MKKRSKKRSKRNVNKGSWLWWLAAVILAYAASAIYFIQQDPLNLNADQQTNTIILFTGVAVGICVISATAHLWLRR
ncbi:MAG: hypothetical protein ACO398_05725 [Kiritimatiellia bacterium]